MTVTELIQTSPDRITLHFDDGTELKTSLAVVTEKLLHVGSVLDDDAFCALCDASMLSLCKARALRIVNARPLSRRELYKKLVEKGESPQNAEECADWLCRMGLISDETYAASLVRHYAAKGYGETRVRQELNRHGIPRELWEDAMNEMPGQDDKLERFIRARLTDPNDKAQIKKISDALFRRGYSWEQIRHAFYIFNSQEDES